MSNILRFTHKSILAIIILMMLTLSIGPYTASAQVNVETDAPGAAQSVAANAPPLGINLLQDPSFEGSYGSTTGPWFQSPPDTICWSGTGICDVNGAGYNSGGAWAGFGPQENSYGDVYQKVTFPRCGATLKFALYIGLYFGPGQPYGMNHYFAVLIDNTTVFEAFGSQYASYPVYTWKSIDVNQFADGQPHYVKFHADTPENFLYFNLDDVSLYATIPPSSGCAKVNVNIHGATQGPYGIPPNSGDRQSYPVNDGPVFVSSTLPFVASERVISYKDTTKTKITHFSELMGLPQGLVSTTYAFPVYDNYNFDSQLRFGNVSNTNATVRIFIGQDEISRYINSCISSPPKSYPYVLAPGTSLRVSCTGVNGQLNAGPVRIVSNVNIVATLRVINKGSVVTSFSEIMGLPVTQWSTIYWMPWYNRVNLDSQIRFGNVSASTAHLHVFIHGQEINNNLCTTSPPLAYPYSLPAKESLRLNCPMVNNGPVKIVSDVPIVASMRVAHSNGTRWDDFSELMGLPDGQKSARYIFPWYNNKTLDSQLRFGNISSSDAHVHVYIGAAEMPGSPFTLTPGNSTRQSFTGIDNGPVRIVSDVNIVASLRVIVNNGGWSAFSELMGLPQGLLTTNYVLPWYNNVNLDTQVRFGVP